MDSLIPEYGGILFDLAEIENKVQMSISDVRDEHSMRYLVHGDFGGIRSILKWRPQVPLREGLTRTLEFYRKYLEHYL